MTYKKKKKRPFYMMSTNLLIEILKANKYFNSLSLSRAVVSRRCDEFAYFLLYSVVFVFRRVRATEIYYIYILLYSISSYF